MREALLDQNLGLKITSQGAKNRRLICPAKHRTDLDIADDIMLKLDNAARFSRVITRRVGLKINRTKTEFMMVGNWSSSLE
jgi:hypothetical protein